MAQLPRNDTRSHDWTMAAVGLMVTLTTIAIFFQQTTIEYITLILYWMWCLADFPRFHDDASWRINLLATTHNHAETISWSEFFAVTDVTASILLVILIPLIIVGIITVRLHPASRTRRNISIHSLPRIMSNFSSAIIPALTYGDKKSQLLHVDPEEHRSAQSPDEFAVEHKLVVNNQLRRGLAETLFIAQLGMPLSATENAFDQFKDHERAMFAIFGLQHFLDERPEAEQLLDALNRSTLKSDRQYRNKTGYPNLSLAFPAFRKVTALPAVQSWIRKYRYVRTALVALHDNDLHLPIRRYRWLKGLDRTLWYALASTGRPWPFVEGAGVVSQSQWETLAARYQVRLNHPVMTLVIDGLETDLRNIGAVVDAPSTTSPSSSDEQKEDDDEDDVSSSPSTDEQHIHRHTPSYRPKMR